MNGTPKTPTWTLLALTALLALAGPAAADDGAPDGQEAGPTSTAQACEWFVWSLDPLAADVRPECLPQSDNRP
jgi:hypothetical protein